MAVSKELTDALDAIDTETNDIASVVQGLRDQIKAGMSPAEAGAVKDRLTGVVDRLKGVAADPNNPVPTPTP